MPPDENDFGAIRPQDWQIRADYADARRIGALARRSFQSVLSGWQGQALAPDDRALQTTIEAQIAASCLGHKPLFFEPIIGNDGRAIARELARIVPGGVEVHRMDSGIAIFRPERIHSIFETDPGFYRTPGGDLMATINGLCACGDNGALLGYGARNWSVPPGVRVIIRDRQRLLFMFFVSHPAEASRFARERLMDIASYTGQQFYYEIRDSNA